MRMNSAVSARSAAKLSGSPAGGSHDAGSHRTSGGMPAETPINPCAGPRMVAPPAANRSDGGEPKLGRHKCGTAGP